MSTTTTAAAAGDTAQEFLSGKLSHVDVAAIEKELKQLWKQAATTDGAGEKSASTVMRACSFNMICFSTDSDAELVCNDLLDELLVHRPGRGILAIYRPEKPSLLDAWVSARCHLEGSSKQICAEQITVCCEGGQSKQLSSVVLPLVISELPVFIYWRAKLKDQSVFEALSRCAGRLLVDSLRDPFDLQHFTRVHEVIRTTRDCLATTDLNWRRLSGWLRALADAFDGFPLDLEDLSRFEKITVTSGLASDSEQQNVVSTQAMLLIGWLASRLGWRVAKQLKANALEYKDGKGRSIVVNFVVAKSEQNGQVVAVNCQFVGGRRMTVAIEETDELSYVVAHADDCGSKEATRANNDLSESALLGEEVGNLAQDPIYEAAVEAAAGALQ